MGAAKQKEYRNYLLDLLDKYTYRKELKTNLKINLYLTLLTLNNYNYDKSIIQKQIDTLEDFLRKTNNLKVKIQLKRKEAEIEKLITEIKEIYTKNKDNINEYYKEKRNIISIIETKDTKELTNLIDIITKNKMSFIEKKEYYKNIRNIIFSNILDDKYESLDISLEDFYISLNYLLNIDYYKKIYSNNEVNNKRIELIKNIINIIKHNNKIENEIIPITLTYLLFKEINNYQDIDTSKFNIDNIKITDLYSFANNKDNKSNTAKWKNVKIPNEYLYNKMKEMIKYGNYYFKDEYFILENINHEFKLSIKASDMKKFLKSNIEHIK